jgi:hypothetical protein
LAGQPHRHRGTLTQSYSRLSGVKG